MLKKLLKLVIWMQYVGISFPILSNTLFVIHWGWWMTWEKNIVETHHFLSLSILFLSYALSRRSYLWVLVVDAEFGLFVSNFSSLFVIIHFVFVDWRRNHATAIRWIHFIQIFQRFIQNVLYKIEVKTQEDEYIWNFRTPSLVVWIYLNSS